MKWLMEACSKLRKLGPVEVRIVLSELYERQYGIYVPVPGVRRPLSSVAMHPAENITDDSVLEESMTLFVKKKIHELFGISHTELLKQTREVVGLYYKTADAELQSRDQSASAIQAKIAREAEAAANAAKSNQKT